MKIPILTPEEKAACLGDPVHSVPFVVTPNRNTTGGTRGAGESDIQAPASSIQNPAPSIEELHARYRATRADEDLAAWREAVHQEATRIIRELLEIRSLFA